MKITVCELRDEPNEFREDWEKLIEHTKKASSDLVLLPEMGLSPWLPYKKTYDPVMWKDAIKMHDSIITQFPRLGSASIIGTRPITKAGKRLNEAFIWNRNIGYKAVHHKYYLPDQGGYWEASWYDRGKKEFIPIETNLATIGFVICSEIWFFEHIRDCGRKGAHIIACPRATPGAKYEKWLAGGRTAAVVSGAFSISSCKTNSDKKEVDLGGHGWIIEPYEGNVLGQTSQKEPFLTLEIDLNAAIEAKKTYPRYIKEGL